jgi:hypothetical protein
MKQTNQLVINHHLQQQQQQQQQLQQQPIDENEKIKVKEFIERYQANADKISKTRKLMKQLSDEQDEIKEAIKEFMKKYNLNNIFTQDGGKVVFQMQNVQKPINKKFLEKRILELLGDINGREFLKKIYANMDVIKREHVMFRMGKSKLQLYV